MLEVIDLVDGVAELILRIFLWGVFLLLKSQTPFIRHIDEEELWMYRYPSIPSIITRNMLFTVLIIATCAIYGAEYAINRKKSDIIKGFKAITLAFGICAIITHLLKIFVGRPRPNFFMRCFPDGYGTDLNNCTGEIKGYMDARKSFPSAHASFAFTVLFFMSLRMSKLLQVTRDNVRFRGFRCILCFIPTCIALFIAVSRTSDYHHHYSDVLFGSLLGITISYFMYFAYYWHDEYLELEEPMVLKHSVKSLKI